MDDDPIAVYVGKHQRVAWVSPNVIVNAVNESRRLVSNSQIDTRIVDCREGKFENGTTLVEYFGIKPNIDITFTWDDTRVEDERYASEITLRNIENEGRGKRKHVPRQRRSSEGYGNKTIGASGNGRGGGGEARTKVVRKQNRKKATNGSDDDNSTINEDVTLTQLVQHSPERKRKTKKGNNKNKASAKKRASGGGAPATPRRGRNKKNRKESGDEGNGGSGGYGNDADNKMMDAHIREIEPAFDNAVKQVKRMNRSKGGAKFKSPFGDNDDDVAAFDDAVNQMKMKRQLKGGAKLKSHVGDNAGKDSTVLENDGSGDDSLASTGHPCSGLGGESASKTHTPLRVDDDDNDGAGNVINGGGDGGGNDDDNDAGNDFNGDDNDVDFFDNAVKEMKRKQQLAGGAKLKSPVDDNAANGVAVLGNGDGKGGNDGVRWLAMSPSVLFSDNTWQQQGSLGDSEAKRRQVLESRCGGSTHSETTSSQNYQTQKSNDCGRKEDDDESSIQ